jgi:hypothetical protein
VGPAARPGSRAGQGDDLGGRGRDGSGVVRELRWLLWPPSEPAGPGRPPPAGAGAAPPAADAADLDDLAGALAAVIGRLLASTSEARHRGDLVVQLQGALDSRILVEQAKGVLMEREGLSAQAAFDRLRRQAQARSRKLDDLAREIIASRAGGQPG